MGEGVRELYAYANLILRFVIQRMCSQACQGDRLSKEHVLVSVKRSDVLGKSYISLSLNRLPKLPCQSYLNGPDNLGNPGTKKKYSLRLYLPGSMVTALLDLIVPGFEIVIIYRCIIVDHSL